MKHRRSSRELIRGHLFALILSVAAGACTPRPDAGGERSCPPCECACKSEASGGASGAAGQARAAGQAGQAGQATPGPQGGAALAGGATPAVGSVTASGVDVSALVESASRKMMHDDGAGCLADLDQIATLDPKMDARLAVTRGQCEMLVGRCQEGKGRIARWYQDETNMHPERAAMTAEQLGSMRCREGDSSDRDRLLRAFFELQQGAYMHPVPPAQCEEHLKTARALIPRVKPRDVDDGQIRGGAQALFHTAANCFARAGECKRAYQVYRELFPPESLNAIADPATREGVVRSAFDSSVERCKGKI